MKFTCMKSALQAAVNIASRAASSKSPIPALEGILLEAGPAGLKLTGYDLKKGIYTTIEADVAQPGSIVLGAKIFGDIVRSLPEGVVTVKVEGLNVSITCENSDFKIVGIDFNDYPELPSIDHHSGISLPQNILGEMIRQTIFAVSDNEARPVYTGEMFEIEGGSLTLVAVDGYRLALRREKIDKEMESYSFIVPGNALSDLEKLCGDNDEDVTIALGSKHISFTIGRTVIISRRLEGDFLNYRKTVPTTFNVVVRADRHDLQRTVERVSLIIDDKIKNPIRCTVGENEMRIVCSTSIGKAEDVCPVSGDGKGLEIGFNNRYILDALKAAPSEEVDVCLNTGSSPCIINPADGSDKFLYMVLPVRLKAE
ncbi:MAG: DNA polymerase III subunit beta [Oscillospiraceae bacterium]|nr:DNA polymerase III subunit beta [Oscillospiraceae bacterium]